MAITLGYPANMYVYADPGHDRVYPQRFIFTLYGDQTGQGAKLGAALFGGKTAEEGISVSDATWASEWDTGPTEWIHLASIYPSFDTLNKDLHMSSATYVMSS